jgi:hypothetical protein
MTDQELEGGEESVDEEGGSDKPADAGWDETADQPHEGEEGQQPV